MANNTENNGDFDITDELIAERSFCRAGRFAR